MNLLLSSPPLPHVRGGWRWHPPPEPHEASSLVCLSQARMLVTFVLPSLQRLEAVTSPSSLGSWRRKIRIWKSCNTSCDICRWSRPLPYPTCYWSHPLPYPTHWSRPLPYPTHTHTHTHTLMKVYTTYQYIWYSVATYVGGADGKRLALLQELQLLLCLERS